MEDLNMNCLTLNNSILYMTNEFGLKYYGDDFQMVWIDWEDDCLHYNLQINDDYWNIDEIYTAMWYNIPEKILFKYLDERLDKALKKEVMPNLENYFKLHTNQKDD